MLQQLSYIILALVTDICIKSDGFLIHTGFNNLVESLKCTAADKQDIGRIDLNQFLMRMFSAALWRNRSRIFNSAC